MYSAEVDTLDRYVKNKYAIKEYLEEFKERQQKETKLLGNSKLLAKLF